jgi:hypothetical protein
MAAKPIALKVLLQKRHLQTYRAFCREYDKAAEKIDRSLKGSYPSKAQYYRWLSGELRGLPYSDHCRILEGILPGWTVEKLFQPHVGPIDVVPDPYLTQGQQLSPSAMPVTPKSDQIADEIVSFYPHRSDAPKQLWMDLLSGARENIDLFANASLFLPEDNPGAISLIKEKAAAGVRVRILMGNPDDPAMTLRGQEERLYEQIPGRIRMALAYYAPLIDIEGIEFRLHGTALYNSIFRYDNHMLINQHIYGKYGYLAPLMHLHKRGGCDLFDTYMDSFEMVWNEESFDIHEYSAHVDTP